MPRKVITWLSPSPQAENSETRPSHANIGAYLSLEKLPALTKLKFAVLPPWTASESVLDIKSIPCPSLLRFAGIETTMASSPTEFVPFFFSLSATLRCNLTM